MQPMRAVIVLLLLACTSRVLDGGNIRVKPKVTTEAMAIITTEPAADDETALQPAKESQSSSSVTDADADNTVDDDDKDDDGDMESDAENDPVTAKTTETPSDEAEEEETEADEEDETAEETETTEAPDVKTMIMNDDSSNKTLPMPDCTQPAFLSFPTDLFRVTDNPGFVWIHMLVAMYLFIAIAIICNEYFCPSLDITAQKMGLSEDVAGATLMSFGSSAPELFISIIAVFSGSTDVGAGTIVGSAVFNILFVIGICGILVSHCCTLSWWPFIRDSFCYTLTVLVLLLLMIDNNVTWWESSIMLLLYGLYIVLMKYNDVAHSFFVSRFSVWISKDEHESHEQAMNAQTDCYKNNINGYNEVPVNCNDGHDISTYTVTQSSINGTPTNALVANGASVLMVDEEIAYGRYALKLSFEDACWRFMITWQFRPVSRFRAAGFIVIFERRKLMQYQEFASKYKRIGSGVQRGASNYTMRKNIIDSADTQAWRVAPPRGFNHAYIWWLLCFPIRYVMYYTIVDCRMPRFERYYMATFLLSVLWISIISYILVWVVTLAGFVFGLPDAVMGITLLAAGTSISDCISSVIVARKGYGDMAVSNSFGSNVFDILIGLGLPWFLQTALVSPGSTVSINSRGLIYDASLLFAAIFGTLLMIYMCGWRLSKKLGYVSMGLYLVFLIFSLMIEFNVLGFVNPPMCDV